MFIFNSNGNNLLLYTCTPLCSESVQGIFNAEMCLAKKVDKAEKKSYWCVFKMSVYTVHLRVIGQKGNESGDSWYLRSGSKAFPFFKEQL